MSNDHSENTMGRGFSPTVCRVRASPPNDVPLQYVFDGVREVIVPKQAKAVYVLSRKIIVKAAATLNNVIFQYVDSVEASDSGYGVAFVFNSMLRHRPAFTVTGGDFRQLAGEDFDKKVAVAAGRFEEAGFYTLSFLLNHVQHGVDFPGRSVDFAIVGYPAFRFYLCFGHITSSGIILNAV
jgi:hypothetical protein